MNSNCHGPVRDPRETQTRICQYSKIPNTEVHGSGRDKQIRVWGVHKKSPYFPLFLAKLCSVQSFTFMIKSQPSWNASLVPLSPHH